MRRVSFAVLGLTGAFQCWGDTSVTSQTTDNTPTVLSPPVVVEAEEPRYVAPTLRDRIGRIWAPVMINGKGPYRLVLDTGANSSAIIPSVAQSLGVPMDEKRVQLHGVTGSAIVPVVNADSMEIGDLYIGGTPLPVVADVFGGAEGVLGPRGMADKRIFIDFGNDLIRIQRSRGQAAGPGYARLPLKFTDGQLPMFELRIGGIKTKAILDTGAQITLGNDSLRDALLRRKREGVDATIIGVTLDEQTGRSYAVPTIALGGIEVRTMRVTFGDVFIFEKWELTDEPAMLVGMDVIGTLDQLVIDYRMRELHMRPKR